MKRYSIYILISFLFFLACGSKGDLKLEPQKRPLQITDLKVTQLGKEIRIDGSLPTILEDKSPLSISSLSRMTLYHSQKVIEPAKFRKKASVMRKIKDLSTVLTDSTGRFTMQVPFKLSQLENKTHHFAVSYHYRGNRSPISNILNIETAVPVRAIGDLKLENERKLIRLKWSIPKLNVKNEKLSQIAGFYVYKKIIREKEEIDGASPEALKAEFKKVTEEPIQTNYFEDNHTSVNGEYIYVVSSLFRQGVESLPSKPVSTKLVDTFPPDVPGDLMVFKTDTFLRLNWGQVSDTDFDHYIVYRKSETEREYKVIAQKVTKNRYEDKSVSANTVYFYRVSSVDKKGNESEMSDPVKERF